jgi:hypothetical protein
MNCLTQSVLLTIGHLLLFTSVGIQANPDAKRLYDDLLSGYNRWDYWQFLNLKNSNSVYTRIKIMVTNLLFKQPAVQISYNLVALLDLTIYAYLVWKQTKWLFSVKSSFIRCPLFRSKSQTPARYIKVCLCLKVFLFVKGVRISPKLTNHIIKIIEAII